MGGNALKTVNTIRLTKSEFEPYMADVLTKLSTKFSYAAPLKYYRNKQSFGDLDIIMKMSENKIPTETKQIIKDLFNYKEIYLNDNTFSFDYQNFQIDLIFKNDEDVESTEFFFAYNDLGNLVGRLANKLNLSFGFEGLNFIIRDHHGALTKKILVSKDNRKIFDFLDLSYDRFLKGFDEVNEIFDFVVTSKYFSSSIFAYENLNHQNRTRNRKRVNYAGFLKYLEDNNITKEYQFLEDESLYIPVINEYFPESNLIQKLDKLKSDFQYQKDLAKKFNGVIVNEITGLEDAELGNFIKSFKFSKINFQEYLGNHTEEDIRKDIKDFNIYQILTNPKK